MPNKLKWLQLLRTTARDKQPPLSERGQSSYEGLAVLSLASGFAVMMF